MRRACFLSRLVIVGLVQLLVAACSVLTARSENLFVTATGSGAHTGANWSNAFQGFDGVVWGAGAGKVSAGDTLWVAGNNGSGNYVAVAPMGGTLGNPVTLKRATANNVECTGSPGWTSTFDSQVYILTTAQHGIYLARGISTDFPNGSANVTIDGQVPNGIKVKGVSPYNVPGGLKNTCIVSIGSNQTFRYLELETLRNGNVDYCSVMVWNQYNAVSTNINFYGCSMHGGPQGIFAAWTDYITVDSCELYDIGNVPTSTGIHQNAAYFDTCSHLIFKNNKLHDYTVEGLVFPPLGAGMDYIYVYNNLFWTQPGSLGRGIEVDPYTTADKALGTHVYIYGNTFDCVDFAAIRFQSSRFVQPTVQGAFVYNNIFYHYAMSLGAASATTTHNYNWYATADGDSAAEANSVVSLGTDPFASYVSRDFHILSTVAATYPRSKGSTLGAPYDTDLDGNARTVPWDIGAYEYPGAGSAGTIQIAPTVTVSEAAGTATMTLTRNGGSVGIAGVSYATSDGTASAPANYTSTSGTKSWANGDASDKTFTVPLSNTAMVGNKVFYVTLSLVTGGATLGQATCTVTLQGTGTAAPCVKTVLVLPADQACATVSPMVLVSSGSPYAYQPSQILDPTLSGKSVFTFTNAAGTYRILTYVDAPNDASNSFIVGTNNVAPDSVSNVWDIVQFTSPGGDTRYVSQRGNGTFDVPQYAIATFALGAGTNTVTIYGREANVLLYSITLERVVTAPPATIHAITTTLTNDPLVGPFVYRKTAGTVPVTVSWTLPVTVTGAPTITNNAGGLFTYVSGSGTTNTVWLYTVGATENNQALDLTGVNLNSGTVQNAGIDADLTLPSAGGAGSLSSTTVVVIDTTRPLTLIGPPSLTLTAHTDVTFKISYTDLNMGRSPTALSTNNVTLTPTGSVAATLQFVGTQQAPVVAITGITGTGTFTISLAAATGEDLAGNTSLAAGPSQSVTVYTGTTMQAITSNAGTVISGAP